MATSVALEQYVWAIYRWSDPDLSAQFEQVGEDRLTEAEKKAREDIKALTTWL